MWLQTQVVQILQMGNQLFGFLFFLGIDHVHTHTLPPSHADTLSLIHILSLLL